MKDFFEKVTFDGKKEGMIRTRFSDGSVMEIRIKDGMAQSFLYDRDGALMDHDIKRTSPYGKWMLAGGIDEGETTRTFYTLLVEGAKGDELPTIGFDIMREIKGELISIPLTDDEIYEAYGEVVRKEIERQAGNIFMVAGKSTDDKLLEEIVDNACELWSRKEALSETDAVYMAIENYAEDIDDVSED